MAAPISKTSIITSAMTFRIIETLQKSISGAHLLRTGGKRLPRLPLFAKFDYGMPPVFQLRRPIDVNIWSDYPGTRDACYMRNLLLAALVLAWAGMVWAAENLAEELVNERLLRFDMEQPKALELIDDEDDWDIAYRIATPSTFDLACRYKEDLYFQARFYLGKCYYIEKRLEVEQEQIEPVFNHFHDKLGDSPEAAQSHDGRLLFSRWSSDDREVSLTAYRRESGKYVITYEEFEPEIVGVARHVQEQELEELPTEHDPVTGKERPAHSGDG
jgi:hypothetical protein